MCAQFYDPTDPVVLAEIVDELFEPKQFFRRMIFNKFERNFDTKTYELQIQTKARHVAPLLASCDSDATTREREEWQGRLIHMPYSKQEMPFTCNDKLKRKKGQTIYPTDRNIVAEMEEQIIDDVQTYNDDLDRREELMCIEAATTGQLITPKMTIDFGYTAENIVTLDDTPGKEKWNNANTNIIRQLREWVRTVRRRSGRGNIKIVIGETAYVDFLKSQEMQDALDNRRINLGSIEPMEVGGAVRVGVLTDPQAELWTYDEYFTSPQDGISTDTDMFPKNKVMVFSADARQGFLYGAIGHCAAPSRTRRYAHSWINDRKGTHYMSMESSPCPALAQPSGILVAEVTDLV